MDAKGTSEKNQWLTFPRVAQKRHTGLELGVPGRSLAPLAQGMTWSVGEVMGCSADPQEAGCCVLSCLHSSECGTGYRVLCVTRGWGSLSDE